MSPVQSSPQAAPTNVRFLTLALCIAMAMLLYLDRYALSPVTGTLLTELKVNKEELGRTIFFAFFFAYAVLQVPAGWLSDTFGARRMLAVYVAVWSLATMYMGFVNGLTAIFMVRFLLGISQAGAYPTAASLLKRWFPYGARGRRQQYRLDGRTRGRPAGFRDHTGTHASRRALVRMGNGPLACGVCPLRSSGPGMGRHLRRPLPRLAAAAPLVQSRRGRAD